MNDKRVEQNMIISGTEKNESTKRITPFKTKERIQKNFESKDHNSSSICFFLIDSEISTIWLLH